MATANKQREKIIKKLTELAVGRTNDVIRLVLDDADGISRIDSLDLALVSEVRRGANGVVEVKLLNRLEVIKLLLEELRAESDGNDGFGSFLSAMNEAARKKNGDQGVRGDEG